jgi:hypothetical protein
MKVYDFPQYSDLWWEIRRGVPTCSNFDKIITAKTGKLSSQVRDYIAELLGDIATKGPLEPKGFVSPAMLNGSMLEPKARAWYAFEHNADVQEVGFCVSDCGRFGGSPDGLIGADGCLELKCPTNKTQVKYLLDGGLPSEYRAQVNGHLIVTGRAYCDFLSYADDLPPLLVRVTPDNFTATLRVCLDEFWDLYQDAYGKIFPDRPMKLAA